MFLYLPIPFIFPIFPSPIPSGHYQFALYFQVSASILSIGFSYWLGSTYRWDYMVSVFNHLAYFISIMLSNFIHAVMKGRNSSFLPAA